MKIIFLDVDGVLNSRVDFDKPNGNGRSMYALNKDMIERIHKLEEHTNAKIVLSSTWRCYDEAKLELDKAGIKFIDITPIGNIKEEWQGNYVRRGSEIKAWLDMHPEVKKYVIIDDDGDMLEEQMSNFVMTYFYTGFQDEHLEKAIRILNEV